MESSSDIKYQKKMLSFLVSYWKKLYAFSRHADASQTRVDFFAQRCGPRETYSQALSA